MTAALILDLWARRIERRAARNAQKQRAAWRTEHAASAKGAPHPQPDDSAPPALVSRAGGVAFLRVVK